VQNTQLGALKGETQNLGPKLIPSSTKQIMQGDGQKTWKRHQAQKRPLPLSQLADARKWRPELSKNTLTKFS